MKARMRDGSGHRHYRYLMEDADRHGNVRIYFRRGGRKIRIRATPGTEAFDREYQTLFSGNLPPQTGRVSTPGTFRWLCEQYYSKPAFRNLDERTRRVRKSVLEQVAERLGDRPYRLMRSQDVAKLRDEKSETPAASNQLVKIIRALFVFACDPDYGLAVENPAAKTKLIAPRNPDGFKPWMADDVRKYETYYRIGTKERLALDLLLFTGSRRSDIVRLGPQMERDGYLIFTEFKGRTKTRKTHHLPILPALRRSIDSTPTTGQLAYLINRYGQPYTPDAFGEWFAARCKAAGIDAGLSAHGLRKFAVQWCAENGATEDELMSLFGWLGRETVAIYVRNANRARMEAKAVRILGERK